MKRTTKYVGLDVHQAMTVATVRSEGGRVIARSVVETSDASIREFFSAMAGSVHVVFEGSSPELCVKVRGSSSMLLLGCLGDLLRFEKREIQVATFAPDRSSP